VRCSAFLIFSSCLAAAQLSPDEIIRRSVTANERDWREAPSFALHDRNIERKDSQVIDHTYAVIMMQGSPYRKLIAIDNHPLSAERQRQEDQKELRELARRRSETPEERESRLRKYQKDREQDHMLMAQMAAAFKFHLVGETTLAEHPVYILDATPDPNYKPPTHEAKVLTGMQGRLWVDKNEFHWARVEAEVIRNVTFGGFLAKVGPGTRFVLEKEPVGGDIWQPKEFSVQVVSSILFFSHNSSTTDEFSDYRRGAAVAGLRHPAPAGALDLHLESQKIEQILKGNDRKQPVVVDHH